MTLGGCISMTTSLAIVIGLMTWCFYKLLTTHDENENAR